MLPKLINEVVGTCCRSPAGSRSRKEIAVVMIKLGRGLWVGSAEATPMLSPVSLMCWSDGNPGRAVSMSDWPSNARAPYSMSSGTSGLPRLPAWNGVAATAIQQKNACLIGDGHPQSRIEELMPRSFPRPLSPRRIGQCLYTHEKSRSTISPVITNLTKIVLKISGLMKGKFSWKSGL